MSLHGEKEGLPAIRDPHFPKEPEKELGSNLMPAMTLGFFDGASLVLPLVSSTLDLRFQSREWDTGGFTVTCQLLSSAYVNATSSWKLATVFEPPNPIVAVPVTSNDEEEVEMVMETAVTPRVVSIWTFWRTSRALGKVCPKKVGLLVPPVFPPAAPAMWATKKMHVKKKTIRVCRGPHIAREGSREERDPPVSCALSAKRQRAAKIELSPERRG